MDSLAERGNHARQIDGASVKDRAQNGFVFNAEGDQFHGMKSLGTGRQRLVKVIARAAEAISSVPREIASPQRLAMTLKSA